MFHQRLQIFVEAFGVLRLRVDDHFVDIHGVIVAKGSMACMHLVNEDAERPPVHGLGVAFVEQNFGGDVLRRATNSISSLFHYFSKSVVDQLQVTIVRNHYIFWLQVPVDDVLRMQILKDTSYLSTIESMLTGLDRNEEITQSV